MFNGSDTSGLMTNQGPAGGDALSMLEGQTMNFNSNDTGTTNQSIFKTSSHPVALFFHLFFRCLAIISYIIIPIFIKDNYVLSFVIIILLMAFDFWTVKNVSGRLLVGLRWWNEINDDGSNSWIFESKENRKINKTDSRIFWGALYITPVVWILFSLISIFSLSFKWLLVDIVSFSFSFSNLLGYYKCEKDAKQKLGGILGGNPLIQGIIGNAITSKVSNVFSGSK